MIVSVQQMQGYFCVSSFFTLFGHHLQVTDDLFDEIATKVLNEDDSLAEG
jgi:hypothetical protein